MARKKNVEEEAQQRQSAERSDPPSRRREAMGKGMDELCIFFLEYRVIRIWGFDLLVPDLCRKIICTGIDDIHRSVLSLVAAVHNNTEGYAQALVKDRLEKTVEP